MDQRHIATASLASRQDGAISLDQLERFGVDKHRRHRWLRDGLIERSGPRSFTAAGSPSTWKRSVRCGMFDLGGEGFVAGRSSSRLLGLDGFNSDHVELIVPRSARGRRSPADVRSTSRPFEPGDIVIADGLRCLSAHRTILEAHTFGFTRDELERAVDSAVRKRLISEQRLRAAIIELNQELQRGTRLLTDVVIDAGGESKLERAFLRLLRRGGLPRPELQRIYREGTRTIARVDAVFPGNLVVELDGHGSHATRQERQRDAQRRTELLLKGCRVLTFTYDDVRFRPDWVLVQLAEALRQVA